MPEKPSRQPEIFHVYEFVRILKLLEDQLSDAIEKLEKAERGNDWENIEILRDKKTQLTRDMFKHLAHALKISNGEVRRLAQFNPENTRYYMNLSLPCEAKYLWMEVEEWIANEKNPEGEDKTQVAKGETLEEAFRVLLNPSP